LFAEEKECKGYLFRVKPWPTTATQNWGMKENYPANAGI